MKHIVLACAAGLSTSLLVERMKEAAARINLECDIIARPVDELCDGEAQADVILLGPQVRFKVKQVQALYDCPVEAVDMMAYGAMNGDKVIARVVDLLGA